MEPLLYHMTLPASCTPDVRRLLGAPRSGDSVYDLRGHAGGRLRLWQTAQGRWIAEASRWRPLGALLADLGVEELGISIPTGRPRQ